MWEVIWMIISRRELETGDKIPRFYGFCYCSLTTATFCFYPIPLNIIIRTFRDLWFKVKHPSFSHIDRLIMERKSQLENEYALKLGYLTGLTERVEKIINEDKNK